MWGLFWIGSIGRDRITSGWSEKGADDDTATGLLLKSLDSEPEVPWSNRRSASGRAVSGASSGTRSGPGRSARAPVVLGCRRLAGCALLEQTGDGREFPPDAVPSLVAQSLACGIVKGEFASAKTAAGQSRDTSGLEAIIGPHVVGEPGLRGEHFGPKTGRGCVDLSGRAELGELGAFCGVGRPVLAA